MLFYSFNCQKDVSVWQIKSNIIRGMVAMRHETASRLTTSATNEKERSEKETAARSLQQSLTAAPSRLSAEFNN